VSTHDITATAGNLTNVNAQIAPVIDSTGYISGDFHIHQLESPDSRISHHDRLDSALAEGLEFITPSDHEHRTDFSSLITSEGVGALIGSAVNAETTTPDYGHFNAWPMTIDSTKANKGAIDWAQAAPDGQDFPSYGNYTMTPGQIFSALLADPGTDTVQINHINSFFGAGGLSIDTGLTPPQDFANNALKRLDPGVTNLWDGGFTALEVWQGSNRNDILNRTFRTNFGDWFNLLNQGIYRPLIANSDTHKLISSQTAFPRNMIASPTDDPSGLSAIADTLSGNVNEGRTFGTNGPFVNVTASAASTGQNGSIALGQPTLISTTDGEATITVDIQSPIWAEFDRVEYYINSAQYPDNTDGNPATPPTYRAAPDVIQVKGTDFAVNTVNDFPSIPGASHLEATATLNLSGLTQDTWVAVVVRGTDGVSKPIFPVVPNDLRQSSNPTLAALIDGNLGENGVLATAMINPLFIDTDGDAQYDAPGVDTTPTVDTDLDGCVNAREQSSLPAVGGERDYYHFWDYFDVWTHPSGQPTVWVKDKTINIPGDILGVARRYGPGPAPPPKPAAVTAALTPPTSDFGYHIAYDRGSVAGSDNWDRAPPDGTINIVDDILGVGRQFGHNCS
jgi:hypothetical protein